MEVKKKFSSSNTPDFFSKEMIITKNHLTKINSNLLIKKG